MKLFVLFLSIFFLTACNSSNIGIIGGADGPTSIFIASKVGFGAVKMIVMLILGIIASVGIYKTRRK